MGTIEGSNKEISEVISLTHKFLFYIFMIDISDLTSKFWPIISNIICTPVGMFHKSRAVNYYDVNYTIKLL